MEASRHAASHQLCPRGPLGLGSQSMRIGIEAKTLFNSPLTGISNYTWNLIRALQRTQPDMELYLYVPSIHKDAPLGDLPRARIRHCQSKLGLKGYFWTKFISPRLIHADGLDAFIAPRVMFPYSIKRSVPVVSIVCDMNIFLCPELMPRGTRISNALWFKSDVLGADRIVAISQGTSDRMKQILGRGADAIAPPAVSNVYRPSDASQVSSLRAKYGIDDPYIVFVGTLEPRKNLITLISAHQAVNRHRSDQVKLVLVGKRGWKNRTLTRMLDRGLPNVLELGYVPESDLPHLYSGAEAFVIPSLYEGYGMPAAEARACGTRVIATDIPELHEAAGAHATFVEPTVDGLTKGIENSLRGPRPGPDRSQSWDDSARVLAQVLRGMQRR